ARLHAEDGRGLYASGGELFSDAIFGRDAIQAAEDILHIRPDIAREVILTMCVLQGVREAPPGPGSNEEKGAPAPGAGHRSPPPRRAAAERRERLRRARGVPLCQP